MKKSLLALWLTCVLSAGFEVSAQPVKRDLYKPVPQTARKLVAGAVEMAKRERAAEAIVVLKKAKAIAPDYVNAHAEYIQAKANFLNRYDKVRGEYEDSMKREPDNPVYPMAMAIAQYQTAESSKNRWLQRVVEIAPADWAWTHYARALLIANKEPETAAAELEKYIEADGSWNFAYFTLSYIQEKTLKKLDAAIATMEKAIARPEAGTWERIRLWEMRLGKAGGTVEAKSALRNELEKLTQTSRDIKILDAVRQAYFNLLEDKEKSKAVELKMRQIDSGWYSERGRILYASMKNASGVPRLFAAANRQFALYNEAAEFTGEMDAVEKIAGLEKLLTRNPPAETKRNLYEQTFKIAEKAGNVRALVKYGDLLFAIDSADVAVPAKIATALANKKDSARALRYARIAEQSTAVFRPVARPANNGATDEEWRKEIFPEQRQRQHYKNMRSLALDALGWSLSAAGLYKDAEIKLRESADLARTERNLGHLAEVLAKNGQHAEAEKVAREGKNIYAVSLKKSFKDEPAKDFELTSIDGRRVRLSELKGKVVMIDFWATWCGPCTKSVPTLVKLYEKYKKEGFEILYVSVDDQADVYKIAPYAKERKLTFPVLLDETAKEQYNVKAFPTTIFIDRDGKVRFRDTGFNEEITPRLLETVTEILLETK
ncbi:MAG TPA: redoxin domain-containing protein [Pyrinomonadaceae bacterium]|jgi:peroxiredoxin